MLSVLLCVHSNGQSLDSLIKTVDDPSLHDTVRLEILGRIARNVTITSIPDSSLYYSTLQYNLASSPNNKYWMSRAINNQGVAYKFKGDLLTALKYYNRSL